jgi:hypothetical protein
LITKTDRKPISGARSRPSQNGDIVGLKVRGAVWVSSFVWLAIGCATRHLQPLDQAALRASRPRTLAVAADRSPAMTAEGPAKEGIQAYMVTPWLLGPAAGLIGTAAALGRDEKANHRRARWMKGCGLGDPVEEIRDTLAEDLAERLSLELLESDRRTKAKDPGDVIKDYPGADLILDIRTTRWGIHRIRTSNSDGKVRFAVGYDGSIRLIDARTRAVVADADCSVQFSNGDDPPTITELLEDDCALLDKGLALSAETCVKRHRAALGLK